MTSRFALIFLLFLAACSQERPARSSSFVADREGHPIFWVILPEGWEELSPEGPLSDTTLPCAAFRVGDLLVHVHTFSHRIPAGAQVARWRRQAPGAHRTTPCAFGGFCGLALQGRETLAWALELDPRHEGRVDCDLSCTIKVTGPAEELRARHDEIERFARSFGLVEEIPCSDI